MRFSEKISVEDALRIIRANSNLLGKENLDFRDCLHRVLAENVISPIDIPNFDKAAMDGYAIKAEDSFGSSVASPVRFKVVDHISKNFDAVKVNTGDPMPLGSDAVVMVEYTKPTDNGVEVMHPVTPGKNVSARGEDIRVNEVVLEKGRIIKPHDIGMLAAVSKTRVSVFKKPTVAIISTGNEIIDPYTAKDGVKDVNSYTLETLTRSLAVPYVVGIVKDDYDRIKESIIKSLDNDLILISGGSSMGSHDILPYIIEELGDLLFHGVSMRPAMPTGFGIIKDTPIFLIPGYPVSAMVAFETFVRPALQEMQGMPVHNPYHNVFAKLNRKIASVIGRRDFVRVKLTETDGELYASPLRSGAGIISTMTRSDGFMVVPEPVEGFKRGDLVKVNIW